ncbi:putative Zn(II)2Cys6 transcription factor [Fusarium austroafricanum]|uniref:Putative Zn(II)2Cys6 transcription factor n=1 Tax=Fusarium austroafricanum TaxID=2364996 RepID=A0A8H4K9U7_9HYPO|nr:putative Zn(II)2Cys6 transcription factor [Fusarium austroafricanum]
MADNAQRPCPRPRPPPNRRRDKVQLSCDPCRHRKLRCDRQHPCGACSRRGLTNSCNYATTSSPTPNAQQPVPQRQSTNLQGRITELESLVVTLMKGQSLPSPAATQSPIPSSLSSANVIPEIRRQPQDEASSPADPGTLEVREFGTSYVQSVHWEAILAKIRGLKEDLVTDNKPPPTGSYLFYGPNRHATRDEILAAVPSRPVVDRLMALYFDSGIVSPYITHSKKFVREYEAFWENPSATSIAWIGLMFSMISIAARLQAAAIEFPNRRIGTDSLKAEYLTMREAFREKAIQCLILARYTMGGPYILETLITVLAGDVILLKDGVSDGWLSISLILHLAMRMGYHRDPDHFSEISPFEGEMRRRVWTTILQLDLVLSLDMGLPRSATDTHIDTKEARNLLDSDFDEDTTEMPSPRPETEWTPILPLIARGRLITALGLICDVNTDINPPSYDKVMQADALLEDVHTRAIPPILRCGTTPHAVTDSPNFVVQRISVETTYYKARILLYRRALINYPVQQPQERDRESVRICLDSALKILSFQQMLHEESQPFGRLCQLRWKVTHIFNQDVLLATSLLCLYLQDIDKFETPGQTTWSTRAEEIQEQLSISHKIWLEMSTTSAEAGKVAKALSIVLENAETAPDNSTSASYDFMTDFDTMFWVVLPTKMSVPKLEEIDPDGDTLLIIHNVNAPFATWNSEIDQQWANALPQHQSSTSKSLELTVLPTEAIDDKDSAQAKTESVDMHFRLCSAVLKLSSPFFKKSMSGNWKATECKPGFEWTLQERDWDAEAFLILMNIFHHKTRKVPQTITLETLAKIATLVDYYDCHETVNLWVEKWTSNLSLAEPKYYSRELLLRLAVARVFTDNKAFRALTEVAIERSRGPIHMLGLPIPQQIIDAIEKKRIEAIDLFIQNLEGICGDLYSNGDGSCQYAQLGYIEKNLFLQDLKPLPTTPYRGFSPSAVRQAAYGFDESTECDCIDDHLQTLRNKIVGYIRDAFKCFENGLDLHQFTSNK